MAQVNPAQLQSYISGVDYPCSKDDLIEHAIDQGADEDVIQMLQELPRETFNSPRDVSEALGETE